MGNIKELDNDTFDDFISRGKVVVDFYADWCGPCKMMAPHFEKAAQKMKDVRFAKLNVDNNYDIAGKFGVMSIPTTIFFKGGELVDRHTGALSAAEIEQLISKVLA